MFVYMYSISNIYNIQVDACWVTVHLTLPAIRERYLRRLYYMKWNIAMSMHCYEMLKGKKDYEKETLEAARIKVVRILELQLRFT